MKKHKIQLDDAMAKRSVCKRNVIVVFTLALAAFSGHAFAEGGCPAGQYPIGGQGVQGCAPIPGAGGARGESNAPQGRWIKTWGAISMSPEGGVAGVSIGKFSKSEAVSEAISRCRSNGGRACRESFSYKNQCAAAAVPTAGSGGTSFGGHGTVGKAGELAMSTCAKEGGEGCHVVYSACAVPEYVLN
jgi:hypothetical protein